MPVLPTYEPYIKQLFLPSTKSLPQDKQAWVKIDLSAARVEDSLVYSDFDPNSYVRFARWLSKRIVEWNFTEEDLTPIPVSFEAILRMPKVDFEYLTQQKMHEPETGLSTTEKKT